MTSKAIRPPAPLHAIVIRDRQADDSFPERANPFYNDDTVEQFPYATVRRRRGRVWVQVHCVLGAKERSVVRMDFVRASVSKPPFEIV